MKVIYLLATLVSIVLSLTLCALFIPLLKRLKAGQNILVYVKEHKEKQGTPTMGGLAFIVAVLLAVIIFMPHVVLARYRTSIVALVIGLSYLCIGFLDDLLKKRHKENLGFTALQKFTFQTVVAIFCGIYCLRAELTTLKVPFFKVELDLGWWIIPFALFVFLGTVNAVNLTDGLDGLAAGTSVPFFLTLGMLVLLEEGDGGLALISFCLVGSLLGYLFFNVSPARVFMGDTGSLSLGGFAASIATFSGNALFLPIVGVCFVLSVISVLAQVIYYKATHGKRVFLMAPIHHHFQKKGYSETRIAYGYFLLTLFLGGICIWIGV